MYIFVKLSNKNNNTNVNSLLCLLPGFNERELPLLNNKKTVNNIFTMAVK